VINLEDTWKQERQRSTPKGAFPTLSHTFFLPLVPDSHFNNEGEMDQPSDTLNEGKKKKKGENEGKRGGMRS
jgi:hypothetical protein